MHADVHISLFSKATRQWARCIRTGSTLNQHQQGFYTAQHFRGSPLLSLPHAPGVPYTGWFSAGHAQFALPDNTTLYSGSATTANLQSKGSPAISDLNSTPNIGFSSLNRTAIAPDSGQHENSVGTHSHDAAAENTNAPDLKSVSPQVSINRDSHSPIPGPPAKRPRKLLPATNSSA
ncbi:uncharacterized protein B0I36DRAFT_323083 [Microdochium trichocladiopsis]|uniref:Uncharacterized protein n=1 Tax=Microdochium trichocladiopsis TaxID=1682393 RepID=A0A9P8Y6V4_9PEZI|nr:uncharacterized protein B0I36DRAFT_323083 [Microdochium trichocladiopsis]KAH7031047.1 hypothetical protein B0I36DRAFT_323083 [Microdochium trichocladiopsis]